MSKTVIVKGGRQSLRGRKDQGFFVNGKNFRHTKSHKRYVRCDQHSVRNVIFSPKGFSLFKSFVKYDVRWRVSKRIII